MNQPQTALPAPWTTRRVVFATISVLLVALVFGLLLRFYIAVFILFVAIVIGVAIRPPIDWLYRRGVPRPVGVVLVYLMLLLLIAGLLLSLGPTIVEQVTSVAGRVPEYYSGLREALVSSRSLLIARIAGRLPSRLEIGVGQSAPAVPVDPLAQVSALFDTLGSAAQAIFVITAIFVLAFYWTLDGDRTVARLLLRVSAEKRDAARDLIEQMQTKVGAYIRGLVILDVSIAVMSTIAYMIIGLPSPLVFGLIAGLMETIPILGPILGAIPPLLLVLSSSPDKVVGVIAATVIVQQLEQNLLVPRVMDKAVGISAIVTMLAVTAFGALFGIAGALLAIPLAAILQLLVNELVIGPATMDMEQPEGRDRFSSIRYSAQQLVQDVRKQVRAKDDPSDAEADQIEDNLEGIARDLDSVLAQVGQLKEAA